MPRRAVAVATCVFIAILLAIFVPFAAIFPISLPFSTAAGARTPSSTIEPLPEFTRESVIPVRYVATGTSGQSGVFWVELSYRVAGESDWTLYAPPWNPDGRWFGALGFATQGLMEGVIPFDTFFARGEAAYEFYTIAVDRGFKEEPAGEEAKAATALDTRPPQLFIASPTPDSWTNRNDFAWRATDEVSGLAGVEAVLDDVALDAFEVPVGAKETSGGRSLLLESDGDHAMSVRAVDRAGNAAVVFVPFHYDPSAPALTITSPARDGYVNTADVDVHWTASDTGAGMAGFRIAVDSTASVDLSADARSHRIASLAERGHLVVLVAVDAVGNFAVETVSFGVDRTPPAVELVSPRGPEAYSNLQGRLPVLWSGSDSGSGIARFSVRLVEADMESPDLPSAAGYTFEGIQQGEHTVLVTAEDRAGNTAEASAKVTVDWTAPQVSITAPGRGATVYTSAQVNWTIAESGSGLQKVELAMDGGTPSLATGTTTHRLSPRPSDGPHAVVVRAWDNAGNMGEAVVVFEFFAVVPNPPTPLGLPALDFWILMLIIGAIAVISAYFAVRRRKRTQA